MNQRKQSSGVGTWLLLAALAVYLLGTGGGAETPVTYVPGSPGVKLFVLVHESTQDTFELSAATVALRNAPYADAIKAGGHRLEIIDPDLKDQHNNPAPLVAQYQAAWAGQPLPVLLTIDRAAKVVKVQQVDARASAAAIVAAMGVKLP